jgi:hypothetical protein
LQLQVFKGRGCRELPATANHQGGATWQMTTIERLE